MIADHSLLYDLDPQVRRDAARNLGRFARRSLQRRAHDWPENSPGAINAWLLLVTTKDPDWRDSLVNWVDRAPTLGEPNEGFFYPDPLGFWTEVRRWATVLTKLVRPEFAMADALSVTTLLHVGGDESRLAWGRKLMRPAMIVFLDEPSWLAAGMDVRQHPHYVPDPHRPQQVYEGFWATADDGTVVGKSPQHPTTHRLYRAEDMDRFLKAAPLGTRKA